MSAAAVVGRGVGMPRESPDDEQSSAWIVEQHTESAIGRRAVLGGMAAVVGAGGAGATALSLASDDAAAQVAVDGLSVSDASFDAKSADPVVNASIGYEWQYSTPQEVRVELLVAETVVAEQTMQTDSETAQSSVDLSGRVADADAWSLTDFDVAEGETIERELEVTARIELLVNGDVAESDSASDTAIVTVAWPSDASYVTVGGTAEITNAEA